MSDNGVPTDLSAARTARESDRRTKVAALEVAKAKLQTTHDELRAKYSEHAVYIETIDGQLQVIDTALEAIEAQLLIHRNSQ